MPLVAKPTQHLMAISLWLKVPELLLSTSPPMALPSHFPSTAAGTFQIHQIISLHASVPFRRDPKSCLLLVHHAFLFPTRAVSSNQNSQNTSCSQSTVLMVFLSSILRLLFPIFPLILSRPRIKYPSSLFHSLSLLTLSLLSRLLPLF